MPVSPASSPSPSIPSASVFATRNFRSRGAGHTTTVDSGLVQGSSGIPPSPGVTERASLGPIGVLGVGPTGQIDDNSFSGALSANGRFVAFITSAGLDPRDTNNAHDVYVRDRLRATTTLLSITPGAANTAPQGSDSPKISGDGRYVVFVSTEKLTADPADDHAGRPAVYVLDRGPADANGDFTGTPVLHMVGQVAAAAACDPDISGDGSQVTYWSSTPQPPAGPLIGCSNFDDTKNTFVLDEDTNGNGIPYEGGADVTRTSLAPPGGSNPQLPRISADGEHVVFVATTALTGDEFGPAAPVAWAYDRQIAGSGAKDAPGNTRFVQVTTSDFTPLVAGDNRAARFSSRRPTSRW